ncbi:metal homeostatis protein bsd2 [Phlebopus sp. FC_14]|nr:metal homeostatis protein bsd2 [Phlebopus sp. FC_14]
MPARYAPLPTQQPAGDSDRELDEAFGPDDEDEHDHTESSLLTHANTQSQHGETPKAGPADSSPAAYDFERDYDYDRPPPGSPPRPSAIALPNDIGNSNGLLPTSPVGTTMPRPSFFRRAVGAILPTHYSPLPTTGPSQPVVSRGSGTQNDGVFANVTAKPSRPVQVRTGDGNVYVVPEETQSIVPPSYAAAQADAVPPYWETTVHAPSGLDTDSGMVIDDLPSGSILTFAANLFTSFFFQFVGFLLTYLLHTTHAAKFGSRAGLGLTLIQYGFYSRTGEDGFGISGENSPGVQSFSEPLLSTSPPSDAAPDAQENIILNITSREWLSFLLMTLGWFLLLSSLIGFWRVKHWESSIRAANSRGPPTPEEIERDIAIRRNLAQVFGLPALEENEPLPPHVQLEEARIEQDLRTAGLL